MVNYVIYLLFILNLGFGQPKENGCLQMDIILVGDLSGSVRGQEQFVIDAFEGFVNRFKLSEEGIRIGIIVFDHNTYVLSNLSGDQNKLIEGINLLSVMPLGGGTKMSTAIETSWNQFLEYGREDVRKMVVIISDGAIIEVYKTRDIINAMKKVSNVEVCGVYVDTISGNEDNMYSLSQDCYVSSSYSALVQTLTELNICL